MEYKELKTKSESELRAILAQDREKLRDLGFKVSSNQLKNIREVRVLKKSIAKILFLLSVNKKQAK
jgi:ribosomal protein L29